MCTYITQTDHCADYNVARRAVRERGARVGSNARYAPGPSIANANANSVIFYSADERDI